MTSLEDTRRALQDILDQRDQESRRHGGEWATPWLAQYAVERAKRALESIR